MVFCHFFPVSKVMLENIRLVPCKTTDASLPSSNNVSINEATDKHFQKITPAMSAPVDGKQNTVEIVMEEAISTGAGSTEKESSCPVNGTEMHAFSDASTDIACKTVDNCPQLEGTSGTKISIELQGTQIGEVIQECAGVTDVSSVPCGSTVKEGEVAVSYDKRDKEGYEGLSSNLSGDLMLNLSK